MNTATTPLTDRERMARRDLSFTPADPGRAKTLTPAQVERYNAEGFLNRLDVFDELEADANRAYFDYLLAAMRVHNDGRDSYAINGYHRCCEGIYDLVADPRILDVVEDIIGPNIVAWATHFFCKLPHDPKAVPWHQDASYWPFEKSLTTTVWLAIDDADEENAAMRVLPGTHTQGPLRWKDTDAPAVLNQEIVDVDRFGEPVSINLKAGQIEVHSDMLAHGSEPNRSDRRRCGLTIRYCPPEAAVFRPAYAKGAVLCRGEDPHNASAWGYCERPCGNHLAPIFDTKPIGAN
ncbi:MAG: phytanoyl-CoA dioxygenase family protein [Planctomycetota bacterium]